MTYDAKKYEQERLDRLIAPMLGRTLESVSIDHTRTALMFKFTDGGRILWGAEGDCCSSSWFEVVDDLGFAGQVLSIEDSGQPPGWVQPPEGFLDWQGGSTDVVQFYFTTVKSNKGRLFIEMRNDSNGYYGGDIALLDGASRNWASTNWASTKWTQVCGKTNEHGEVAP